MFVRFFKLSFKSYDASCQFVGSEALPDWLDIIFTEILVLFLIDMSVFRYISSRNVLCSSGTIYQRKNAILAV
jgi:hypothetical protein